MRSLVSIFIFVVLLAGCSPNHTSSLPPFGPFNAIRITRTLGSTSLIHTLTRPTAILGILATHHLARPRGAWSSHPSLVGILQQAHLLHGQSVPAGGAQTSLETLGIAVEINIPDLLNRSPSRADTLNTYIDHMQQALSEALIQQTLLETFLDDTRKNFSAIRRELSAEQKKQSKAMKGYQFAEASMIQEHIVLLERELADIESKKNEADNMNDMLSEMIEISQKRLLAIRENREILIAGLSVKELPGMDNLGILKTTKRRGLLR